MIRWKLGSETKNFYDAARLGQSCAKSFVGKFMARSKRAYLRNIWAGKKCVLCGGLREAESAEHAPPTVLFHDKARPRGLEVPSCVRCNSETSHLDQLVTMVAMSSDPETIFNPRPISDYQRKIIAGTANNTRLVTKSDSKTLFRRNQEVRILDSDGIPSHMASAVELDPKVSEGIAMWAVKQTLALWYINTNTIVSHRATIDVDILTNATKRNDIFDSVIAKMGPEKSLGSGKEAKHDEFSYRIHTDIENGLGVIFAQYHGGMAFISTINDRSTAKLSRRGLTFKFGTNAYKGIHLLLKP